MSDQRIDTFNHNATPYEATVTKSVTGKVGVEIRVFGETPEKTLSMVTAMYKAICKELAINPGGEVKEEKAK